VDKENYYHHDFLITHALLPIVKNQFQEGISLSFVTEPDASMHLPCIYVSKTQDKRRRGATTN